MLTFKHLKWKWEIVHFEKTVGTLLKRLNIHLLYDLGASQVGLVVKNLPASAGGVRDMSLMLGWEDPLEEGIATHPVILPGESHGLKSLVDYSPNGHRELDVTEVT